MYQDSAPQNKKIVDLSRKYESLNLFSPLHFANVMCCRECPNHPKSTNSGSFYSFVASLRPLIVLFLVQVLKFEDDIMLFLSSCFYVFNVLWSISSKRKKIHRLLIAQHSSSLSLFYGVSLSLKMDKSASLLPLIGHPMEPDNLAAWYLLCRHELTVNNINKYKCLHYRHELIIINMSKYKCLHNRQDLSSLI